MIMNAAGIAIIMEFEQLRLAAYHDCVGRLTIGYGHALNVKPGDIITEEKAKELLIQDIERIESKMQTIVNPILVTQNQWSAMVSLAYNIGLGAFEKSTLVKYLLICRDKAADEFLKWKYGTDAQGRRSVLLGLCKRRAYERNLFLKQP